MGSRSTRSPSIARRPGRGLGLPSHSFIAAVLGRISAWKGQELLARAMQHVDGDTLIAGEAWPGQERHEHALMPYHRVHKVGFVDPNLVYGAADVVVVPSTTPDPLPNAAMEAAAAGCCVVAADHGGLPEIITDGVTGRLFTPSDGDDAHADPEGAAGLTPSMPVPRARRRSKPHGSASTRAGCEPRSTRSTRPSGRRRPPRPPRPRTRSPAAPAAGSAATGPSGTRTERRR